MLMKKWFLFLMCLGTAVAAQASYLPFFSDIRASLVDRQVVISNAPPITAAGKKELGVLKGVIKLIDKPSTSLKVDLKTLAGVVTKVNKGASNETFALELRTAVSNYFDVLVATNTTLVNALSNANNNPALKAKAQLALGNAQIALASVNPEANLNGAGKALATALTKYLAATKAVLAAVNAQPVPVPAPKAGTVVVQVNGMNLTFKAEFAIRYPTATGLVGEGTANGSGSTLLINIPSNGGPGDYQYSWILNDTVGGTTITFAVGGVDAHVTSASASAVVGTINGTAQVTINGGAQQNLPFTARFSGKKFSFL